MQGLSFADYTFGELFAPLMPDFASLYWIADFFSNPFPRAWYDANEAYVEAMVIVTGKGQGVWRPGLLAEMASVLYFDEWSYLTGYSAGEKEALPIAKLFSSKQYGTKEYIDTVGEHNAIYIVHPDGWWEVYTPRTDWLAQLQEHLPGLPVNSDNFGSNYPA